MMRHWRITKYNPLYRDNRGAYKKDEWISYDDIGRTFDGVVLSKNTYEEMEARYIAAAMHFVGEAQLEYLEAVGVEARKKVDALSEGKNVDIADLPNIIREIFRNRIWCKLERYPIFYLHFG